MTDRLRQKTVGKGIHGHARLSPHLFFGPRSWEPLHQPQSRRYLHACCHECALSTMRSFSQKSLLLWVPHTSQRASLSSVQWLDPQEEKGGCVFHNVDYGVKLLSLACSSRLKGQCCRRSLRMALKTLNLATTMLPGRSSVLQANVPTVAELT